MGDLTELSVTDDDVDRWEKSAESASKIRMWTSDRATTARAWKYADADEMRLDPLDPNSAPSFTYFLKDGALTKTLIHRVVVEGPTFGEMYTEGYTVLDGTVETLVPAWDWTDDKPERFDMPV